MWAFAREGSAKEQMRACFESNTKRDDYAQQLHERFSEQAMYEQFVSAMKIEQLNEDGIIVL
jgi:hypothetical protein